ncbi:DUF4914 family protein [Bengtsoniella intestinalis]|uniref:DUF4914 family protein n=1 Tax=Bengtsoniella intestinalis TaxID=3073143 RepID=UPI00391EF09A
MFKRLSKIEMTDELKGVLDASPDLVIPTSKEELVRLTFGSYHVNANEVSYTVGDKRVQEATVVRCKNGIVVNYMEDYMRRRDPNSMLIGDDKPTDKVRFEERYPDMTFPKCARKPWTGSLAMT